MRILSIDVGIKNLAFCIFDKKEKAQHFEILKWDVVNISEQIKTSCCIIEKNKHCDKPAKYKKNNDCYCLKHSKKQSFLVPTKDIKPNHIQKQKIQTLYDIADKYNIKYEKPVKKADLVILINDYFYNCCFEEINPTNASKVDLVNIGKNIKCIFDTIFFPYEDSNLNDNIDYVIIENQISPIANRMKTIQGMIAQYFIMNSVDNIEFISASNKLKDYDVQNKEKYSDRKKLSIEVCLDTLKNNFNFQDQLEYFNIHKKKDDLADSFLQGLWFIKSRQL